MKKIVKKISLILAVILACSGLSACGGGSSKDTVSFWIKGDSYQLEMYTALAEEFNKTYGAEHGIKVVTSTKPVGSYASSVLVTAGSESGPDIFLTDDETIKTWIIGGYYSDIEEEYNAITDMEMGDVFDNVFNRLRYDVKTNTSNEDDPLYGVPIDIQPTALYYNKTKLEEAGVVIISVDEADMDKWNNGEIADKNGVWKKDTKAKDVTVPKKGFYRSETPYYYSGDMTRDWVAPTDSEILVFNNRIAMNWDEVEDISMLFSPTYNPKNGAPSVSEYGTSYGYFTEWWFNYGWSVGGDCLNDLTGEGEWNFSLLDPNPNYVVMNGSFTGRTGKVYEVGETIGFLDKMDIKENEVVVPDDYGDYMHADGSGKVGIWSGVNAAVSNGTLAEMPSTREAFCRYLRLGAKTDADINGESGLDISPNPLTVAQRSIISYFSSQEVVFMANSSAFLSSLSKMAADLNFEFGIAPLVVYKEYEDASDPACDTVVAEGKEAGHCNALSAVVRAGSTKKEEAVTFLKWVASTEGQKVRAKLGFFPNQMELVDDIVFKGVAAENVEVFGKALAHQQPGDWWYMQDCAWVQKWCTDLNASVRNGTMTYAEWLEGNHPESVVGGKVVVRTNEYLKLYEVKE